MAGDWIKMRGNLWDDPRVSSLCDLTGASEAAVIGGLYWLWATADQHTENGILPGLTTKAIDRKTGVPGLGAALLQIGWLEEEGDGVCITRFEEHNGASAKRRSLDAKRKANDRSVSASQAEIRQTESGQSAPVCGAREEKRREEIEEPAIAGMASTPPSTVYRVPDCPHKAIVDLYHETLPTLRRVEVWSEARATSLRARWREVCAAEKYDQTQGLAWFKDFFLLVSRSKFLTGRAPPRPGSDKPFSSDLEWLLAPKNFVKVVEGNYT